MKTPTIEQIDALIRREFPGFRLDVGSKVEVAEGPITTYRGEVPPEPSASRVAAQAVLDDRR